MIMYAERLNSLLWGPFTVALVIVCGTYHTVKSGFIQLRLPRLLGGGGKGRLGAVTSALAASLGTGNITGCAAAIASGGPGAVFWMWVSAFGGMALAYSENFLGAQYGGKYPGAKKGPMLYIEKGTGLKSLALVYAAVCLCTAVFMGGMSQSAAFAEALSAQTGIPLYLSSVTAAILTGAVLFSSDRATEGVMKLSARLVPFMGILYAAGCVLLLAVTKSDVLSAFSLIISSAFTPSAAAGGAVGISVKKAVSTGLRRGIFSNEAGMGSSALVHSEADFGSPEKAGAWAAMEVFLDTMVCCTLTALTVICTGASGGDIVTGAFSGGLGRIGGVFVCLCICLFAWASVLGWSCYGEKCLCYLGGGKRSGIVLRIIMCACAAAAGFFGSERIFGISDIFNGILMLINLPVITFLIHKNGAGEK